RRVAVHARGEARKRACREERAASKDEPAAPPPDVGVREACDLVHEELDRLPEPLRTPVLLCYLEGRSRDEVAEQLGVTVGTVKGRLERGRAMLRERLVRRGVPLTAGLLLALSHSPAGASSPALVQAAVAAATGPTARVAALARGGSATMILSKFKLAAGLLVLAGVCATRLRAQAVSGPPRAAHEVSGLTARLLRARLAGGAEDGEVVGRVLDAKGNPLAGAKVSVWSKTSKGRKVAETGADGRFRFAPGKDEQAGTLVARAKGLGADWVPLRGRPAGEVTLRLEEDVPVQGRVLDLEGRPIAGLTVKVTEVMRSRTAD